MPLTVCQFLCFMRSINLVLVEEIVTIVSGVFVFIIHVCICMNILDEFFCKRALFIYLACLSTLYNLNQLFDYHLIPLDFLGVSLLY